MQRIQLHIESKNWFSPMEDYTMLRGMYAAE
jgi:hypothetical protein